MDFLPITKDNSELWASFEYYPFVWLVLLTCIFRLHSNCKLTFSKNWIITPQLICFWTIRASFESAVGLHLHSTNCTVYCESTFYMDTDWESDFHCKNFCCVWFLLYERHTSCWISVVWQEIKHWKVKYFFNRKRRTFPGLLKGKLTDFSALFEKSFTNLLIIATTNVC